VSRGTIKAGDYALKGDEASFAIERKSLDDFVSTVSTGWDRFQRELARMEEAFFPTRVIIVEGTHSDSINHQDASPKIEPGFVMMRVSELTMMNVNVLFCDNPVQAAGQAISIFKRRNHVLREIRN
jgi:ERCC4-type nuclease